MVVRPDLRPGTQTVPEEFRQATESMKSATFRSEVTAVEMRAPQRIAPYSFALSAEVEVDAGPWVESEDEGTGDRGTGRLILLHDPDGNEAWGGTYRFVAYVRADVDPEQIADGMLAQVAWSWMTDALDGHDAPHSAASGTVTTVSSEAFGQMAEDASTAQVEIRASWTPTLDEEHPVSNHVEAWGELLCTAVGLEPVPDGVTAIPSRRGPRGH